MNSDGYEKIGKAVDDQLAFTYFYPSILPDPDNVDLWPWGAFQEKDTRENDADEKNTQELFSWRFLGSYASTALSDAHSAEEGSLHETEFIAPFVRSYTAYETPQPVYLVGYICVNEASGSLEQHVKESWQSVVDTLQIGGERSYGWGRVALKDCNKIKEKVKKCFSYSLNYDGERPTITVPAGGRLLAHTDTKSLKDVENGTLEPLVGRETMSNASFGKEISKARICWVPGTTITEEKTFQIQPKGIWG